MTVEGKERGEEERKEQEGNKKPVQMLPDVVSITAITVPLVLLSSLISRWQKWTPLSPPHATSRFARSPVTPSASCGTWPRRTLAEPHTSSSTWAARRAGTPTASNTGSDHSKQLQMQSAPCCVVCAHFPNSLQSIYSMWLAEESTLYFIPP